MQSDRYQIKNVELWTNTGIRHGVSVLVENGILTKISDQTEQQASGLDTIDGHGAVLMPAGVDPQVHLRVPGQPEKETALSGLEAARAGGIAAVLTMPNTNPVLDDVVSLNLAKKELDPAIAKTGVQVLYSAAITKGQKGKQAVDYQALAEWGVAAFTDDGVGVLSDELMAAAFDASEKTGLPILQHAEMPGHGGVLAPGPVQLGQAVKAYPEAAEVDMVRRDVALLRRYPMARYHVLHASAADTVELVKQAKKEGYRASVEVTPHHLWFCADDITPENSSFKMNPPLRSKEDRLALQEGLRLGDIDFVSTDHAPHEPEVKTSKFKTAAYGTVGLETSLPVLLSLYNKGVLSFSDVIRVFSKNPAAFLGIDDRYGDIEAGRPFNAVLVDKDQVQVVSPEYLKGKSKNSCFLGSRLSGKILMTCFERKIHSYL
jgi:dihydroorotase